MLLPPAGKRQRQALMAADSCSTPSDRLFVTEIATQSNKFLHNISRQHQEQRNPRRFSGHSAAQCGLTRLQPQRKHPQLSGQQAANGRTHLPDPHASPGNRLPRAELLDHSLAEPARNGGQPAAQVSSTAATPVHCASSQTDYPGTLPLVAGRQKHTAPNNLAARIKHDSRTATARAPRSRQNKPHHSRAHTTQQPRRPLVTVAASIFGRGSTCDHHSPRGNVGKLNNTINGPF
jgi:hypothetical protein